MTLFGLSPTGIKFTRIISLCIVAVVLLLVTACGEGATATPGPTSTPAPVVITDSNGKQVIFTRPLSASLPLIPKQSRFCSRWEKATE